jgi:hypothetical protein
MRTDRTITIGEVVDVIERLKRKERRYCDEFCKLNSGKANDERLHDATLILAALNSVLYELDALNVVR